MKRTLALCVCAFLLSACASTWRHPKGYGEDALSKDMFTCRVIARESALEKYTVMEEGRAVRKQRVDKRKYEETFRQCMEARGWKKERVFTLFGVRGDGK